MSQLPIGLVQHVARELLERAVSIKYSPVLMREISRYPLSIDDFQEQGLTSSLTQWRISDAPTKKSLLHQFNPFKQAIESRSLNELVQVEHQPAASLVFAPLVLDETPDALAALTQLPQWFSDDGVLLFATLGAGGLPEIVNVQPEWLELLAHWPNIMDMGRHLQDLHFGLPVLDVETVQLSYSDFNLLWADVQSFIPSLSQIDHRIWHNRLYELFTQGLRQLSVEVLYGQVWQVQPKRQLSDTQTISLESLTAQLHHRKTFGGTE